MFNLDKTNMHHLLALPWNLCMTLTCYSNVKLQKNPEKVKRARNWTETDWWRFSLIFNFPSLRCPGHPLAPMHAGAGSPLLTTLTKQSTPLLQEAGGNPELEEIEPQPLDMSVPTDSCRSALTYFALLPIVLPLWLTLPDTRKQSGESWLMSLIQFNFQGGGEEEEENAPLDLSWPDTCRERITYLAFLPIIIPLWLTLPDTRKESG